MAPSLGTTLGRLLPSRKRDSLKVKSGDGEKVKRGDRESVEENAEKSVEKSVEKNGDKSTSNTANASPETTLRTQLRRAQSSHLASQTESPTQRNAYGVLDYSEVPAPNTNPLLLSSIPDLASPSLLGKTVDLRARIHTIRAVSASLVFILLRQQLDTIQGVLSVSDAGEGPTEHMVRWGSRLEEESIVHVKGVVQRPKDGEVHSTSVHTLELRIVELHVVSGVEEPVPFSVYEADLSAAAASSGKEEDDEDDGEERLMPFIPDRSRLASRIIHLRSASAQSIFRIQSTVSMTFRSHLSQLEHLDGTGLDFVLSLKDIFPPSSISIPGGFLEIHTPKLQGGASESGASVFKLKYFSRLAFLAQSPQLPKQMSVSADFPGVFEVGPVFRAENSNTKRHLTEYTGLDVEMQVGKEYHEVMAVVDDVLKAIFRSVYTQRKAEVEVVQGAGGAEDLVWLDKTLVMAFADGIQMLIDDGYIDDDTGLPPRKDQDLTTRAEIRLGQLVKSQFHTDYYILDLFPQSARPFYTMPANPNTQSHLNTLHPTCGPLTHSFDIFLRGQEITTGGQRIHSYPLLLHSMSLLDISPRGLEEYLDAFRWGAPPHGGAGIGLERLVMLILGVKDIRQTSMFPRDPRSLMEPPKGLEGVRHPEADTLGISQPTPINTSSTTSNPRHPPHRIGPSPLHQSLLPGSPQQPTVPKRQSLPTVPALIANYGDAANTSWLDDRYLVWRDGSTGAAIGFVPSSSGFAIIVGDPLCDKSQYPSVVSRFLQWLKHGEQHRSIKSFLQPSSSPSPSSPHTPSPSPHSPSHTHPSPLPPLKPIWLLASSHLEHTLGTRLSWLSFTCVAESRVELSGEVPAALQEKEVARKVRKAEGEGVGVGRWMGRDGFFVGVGKGEELNEYDIFDGIHIDEENARGSDTTNSNSKSMPLSLKHTIDARIREWRDSRAAKGGQVRLTEVEVWRDYVHREYFVALAPRKTRGEGEGEKQNVDEKEEEQDGEEDKKRPKERDPELIPVALVVLHQLSPMYGFQVKYALDFPSTERWRTGSTSGAIESALSAAMRAVASTGSGRLTFGTSATSRLTPVRGVKGVRVKILSHAYEAISERMSLRSKGDFRKKMGAEEEDVYICYPRGGLGGRGAKAVLDFCVAES
ncbi:aspartyl-tRNA synthetase [Lentinula edodes]|nr:aspartyl-tRNA synthetase [Lentinula edodes]